MARVWDAMRGLRDARVRAVSNRSMSLMSAAGALALLPLAVAQSDFHLLRSAHDDAARATFRAAVVTAMQPLNLSALTQSDFGDE